jgi:hypothetical protein
LYQQEIAIVLSLIALSQAFPAAVENAQQQPNQIFVVVPKEENVASDLEGAESAFGGFGGYGGYGGYGGGYGGYGGYGGK